MDFLNNLPDYGAPAQEAPQPVPASFYDALPEYKGAIGAQNAPAAPSGLGDTLKDVAKSAGIGLANGAVGIAGLPGTLRDGVNWLSNKVLPLPEGAPQPGALLPSPDAIRGGIEKITGPFYQPQTTLGKYAESVDEMVPAVAAGPGGIVRKAAQAIGSGVGAEAAGELAKGSAYEPLARVGGALAGGFLPSAASRVVTPLPVSEVRKQALDTLGNEGVTSLTAGQKTGNIPLRYAESVFGDAPFSGGTAPEMQKEGLRQFTQAATSRAGVAGEVATPEVLADNQRRLGAEFSRLSANNTLQFDPQFGQDLTKAVNVYAKLPAGEHKGIVEHYFNDILQRAQGGSTMPGADYQMLRSRLSAASAKTSDYHLADALREMRNALDSAMERSIAGTPDAGAWQAARQQYGAQKVLEKAASRAGELAPEGIVTPANLRGAITAGDSARGAYARGEGQFADLARAGNQVMTPLPNSGSAQRVMEAGGVGGAMAHLMTGGITPESLAASAAMIAGPGLAGRALMSRPVQKYLANQVVGQPSAAISKQAQLSRLIDALVEASRRQIGNQGN